MKRTSDRLLSRSQVLATIAGAIVLYLASWWPMRGPSDLCQAPAGRPWLVRWSASGMESSLATLLVLAGFAADLHRDPPGSSARAPAWCWALASLVRPEACLLLGLLALRSALGPGPLFTRSREVAWTLLPVALLGGSWLAYAASTYGTIVPTTLASKAAEGTPALQNLLVQAQELAADRGVEIIALLAAVPLLAGRLRREWREHLVPVGWLVLLPLFYASSRVLGITR